MFGQLGLGLSRNAFGLPTDFASSNPLPTVDLGGDDATWVATGESHTCVVLGDQSVKCFGSNSHGQLGYGVGNVNIGVTPRQMSELSKLDLSGRKAAQVSAGNEHTCVLFTDGFVTCFGRSDFGALGYEDNVNRGLNEETTGESVDLGTGFLAKSIASGGTHNCAVSVSNQLKCWGGNDFGQLGIGSTEPIVGASPGQMGNNLPVVNLGVSTKIQQLTLGEAQTCVVFEDGTFRCWGRGQDCETGQGSCANTGSSPAHMGANLMALNSFVEGNRIIHACSGFRHGCVLYTDPLNERFIKCFGTGGRGVLGYNTLSTTASFGFSRLPTFQLGGVSQGLFCGKSHGCAVLVTGHVFCWGNGEKGQLGAVVDTGGILALDAEPARLFDTVKAGTRFPTTSPTPQPTASPSTSKPTNSPTSSPTVFDVTLCGVTYRSTTDELA